MRWDKELAVRYLSNHLSHEGFEPVSSDEDRTIGWRCACKEDGWDTDVPEGWYNRKARHSAGPWADYQEIRNRWAIEMSQELIRRMHDAHDRKPPKSEEEKTAEKKAEELLLRCLSEKQRAQLTAVGYFEQLGGDGRLYRLWGGNRRSIERVEDGEVRERLCIHPNIWVPAGDTILAQKLLVQGDIVRLYKTANVTPVR